ncbi:DUF1631 family protein [Lysobacter korlensis]|uniref:DUF1631 family protein n=1 Tax=Lysobacter korlensis TaxID=553636 RepID=A0ABV6RJ28_9GAMM
MPSLAAAALPRRVRDALQAVLSLVLDHVAGPLERVLDEIEQQLHRSAEQTDDLTLRVQRLGQLRALQRNRDRLGPRFIDLLEAEFAAIREPVAPVAPPPSSAVGPSSTWELRLLEDDEASEDALLRAITIRYESRAGLPLQLLGQRFGVLGARPAFDAEHLPVGPHRMTVLLSQAAQALEIAPETRLTLLQSFEQRVLAHYEALAAVMNDSLAQHNVLPSMTFVPLRTKPRLHGEAADPTPAAPAPAVADAIAPPAASFDFMQQLLARRRGLIERLRANPGMGQAHAATVPTEEVVAALAPLQGRPLPPIDRLRDELQRRFEASGAGVLSPIDADVFELFGLMHAQITRQLRPGSASVALLERLQATVLREALQDHAFFDRPQHPARQLLEAVAAPGVLGSADDDLDPQLRSALEHAVNQVIERNDDDPRAFEAANEAIQEQLRALARRSEVAERRQVESARGKERLADARERAAALIRGLLGERSLPRVLQALIHQAWADVLTLTLLRHDASSAEWSVQMDTTRQIIAVAVGEPPPAGLDVRIREALTLIGYHEEEAAAIASHLGAGIGLDEDSAASRTELVMRLKARARLGGQALPEIRPSAPLEPDEQAQLELLRTMRAGGQFEFIDEAGTSVRRRLAWIGPVTNATLFVNRRGQRAAEYTLDELARMLAKGAARPVGDDGRSVVDRAWEATLASLRRFGHDDTAAAS